MLPANGLLQNQIVKHYLNGELAINYHGAGASWKPQHLYITSDDPIEVADYRHLEVNGEHEIYQVAGGYPGGSKKIIASTDPSLSHRVLVIPTSFIKAYCKAGGVDRVMVEYLIKEYVDEQDAYGYDICKPKVAPDNTISITLVPPERVIYSKEDMKRAWDASKMSETRNFDDWIENYL